MPLGGRDGKTACNLQMLRRYRHRPTLRTIILNFESSFKKAESKAIYREDAKIARKSINLSFLKKNFSSGLLASLAPSRFMQLKFWSEACLVKNNIAVLI